MATATTGRRRATWLDETTGRTVRRCSGCMVVKDRATEFYVSSRSNGKVEYDYLCKSCRIAYVGVRQRDRREDPRTRPAVLEEERERARSWRERHPERYAQTQRAYRQRVMADPERRARWRESQRMNYRLAQEQLGRKLDDIGRQETAVMPRDRGGYLAVAPLLPYVRRFVAAHAIPQKNGGMDEGPALACLGLSVRRWWSWQNESATARLNTLDSVLTGLDLLWWEVYDPVPGMFSERQRDDVLAWLNVVDRAARLWEGEGAFAP